MHIRIFKEHIEATVKLNIPIDTCSRLEAYVDYFTSAIIEAASYTTASPSWSHGHKEVSHFKHRG